MCVSSSAREWSPTLFMRRAGCSNSGPIRRVPYYKDVFGSGKELILYCQSAWRSSLAAAVLGDMGLPRVAHFEGGFKAWKESGAPVARREP